jgi:hypothetical protein
MSISFYNATIKPLKKAVKNLRRILSVGSKHAQENGISENDLLQKKLFEDMFDLRTQIFAVQMLGGHQGALRIAGITPTPANMAFSDFAGADALLETLLNDLDKIDPDHYQTLIDAPVQCDLPIGSAHFETALEHMQQWVIPHTYFHVTTAYNILRHNGVPLGKADYLGAVNMRLE